MFQHYLKKPDSSMLSLVSITANICRSKAGSGMSIKLSLLLQTRSWTHDPLASASRCWDYRHRSLHPANVFSNMTISRFSIMQNSVTNISYVHARLPEQGSEQLWLCGRHAAVGLLRSPMLASAHQQMQWRSVFPPLASSSVNVLLPGF